jgi:hypothetical protein
MAPRLSVASRIAWAISASEDSVSCAPRSAAMRNASALRSTAMIRAPH